MAIYITMSSRSLSDLQGEPKVSRFKSFNNCMRLKAIIFSNYFADIPTWLVLVGKFEVKVYLLNIHFS